MAALAATVAIDPEVQHLIPALRDDEKLLLEESLRRDGCRDPLVVWQETNVLLDGHNRFDICTRLGIDFAVKTLSFETKDGAMLWVVENQLGRRNLADIDRIALAARREPLVRACVAKRQGTRTDLPQNSAESSEPQETRQLAAKVAGVSHDTYTKGKVVLAKGTPELVQAIRDGDATIHAAAEVAELPAKKQVAVIKAGKVTETAKTLRNRRQKATGNNEWGTPKNYVEAIREVMGSIDVDPATHANAQARIQATTFYTAEDDGLSKHWFGTVFLNPPYARRLISRYVQKLVDEFDAGRATQAVLLVNNETDASWFQLAGSRATHICFPSPRIAFLRPNGVRSKHGPLQGQVLLYFGPNGSKFLEVFSKFGLVVTPACGTPLEV